MHLFVTGGSGFVGRNLIGTLVAQGHSIRALARSASSQEVVERLGAVPVLGDLASDTALSQGMQGCDAVVHAAADVSQTQGSSRQEQTNVEGTKRVFRIARERGLSRGVHISTEAVLADGNPLVQVDERRPLPAAFAGGYSRSKALAEAAALDEQRDGFGVTVLRPRMVWGRDDSTLLPALVKAARSGQLVWIDGGRALTSTTHIDNLVEAIGLALEPHRPGGIYFITDGPPVVFRDFVSELLKTQGVVAPTRSMPRWFARALTALSRAIEWTTFGRWEGPLPFQTFALIGHEMTFDDALARKALDYRPRITREQGLAQLNSAGPSTPGKAHT
jgi:nucleoside-diphosphate-sugar epimerase